MNTHILRLFAFVTLAGCATAHRDAPAAAPTPAPLPAPEAAPPAEPPVATCKDPSASEGCFPDEAYKDWLCGGGEAGAAIRLFQKGTPWTRAYVTRNVESWNPGGHSRASKARLALDEEVVILHPYKPSSGIMIMGSTTHGWTSVDAVRVDGTCVSLMADEITMKRPPAPTHAPIAWDKLADHTRDQLLTSPDVRKKADLMAKACAADSDKRCKQAKVQLADAVVSVAQAPTQS